MGGVFSLPNRYLLRPIYPLSRSLHPSPGRPLEIALNPPMPQPLRLTLAGLSTLAALFAGNYPATAAPTPPVPPAAVAPARLETISRRYLGTPYRLDCLGEGCKPDADPQFTRQYADCQTLLEQVFAEALAPYVGGLDASGHLVRYYGGRVRIEDRYHYCLPDWLNNPWPVRDITAVVGGRVVQPLRRRIDRPALLAGRGANARLSPTPVQVVDTTYIPWAKIPMVAAQIPDGTVAAWVSRKPEVVAGHLGLLFRKNGVVVLRHASQRKKRVIDQPLLEFVKGSSKSFIGLKVLQPDVAGLKRG